MFKGLDKVVPKDKPARYYGEPAEADEEDREDDDSGDGERLHGDADGVICCGAARASRFCPECGKKMVVPHPLGSLLDKCQTMASHERTRAENIHKNPRGREKKVLEGDYRRFDATAKKWEDWTRDLLSVIRLLTRLEREGVISADYLKSEG